MLRHYVAHSYGFVATPYTGSPTTGRMCLMLTYTSPVGDHDHLLPLKTGSIAADAQTEIIIYALGEGRLRPYVDPDSGWSPYRLAEINLHELRTEPDPLSGETTTNYPELFMEAVTAVPDTPGFIMEYSGALESSLAWTDSEAPWLTRLRTRLDPAQMAGPDLPLEILEDQREVARDYQILVAAAPRAVDPMMALCALALVTTLGVRRRRNRQSDE